MQAAMEKLDQEDKIGYGGVSAELPGFLQDEDGKLCCFVCLYYHSNANSSSFIGLR